MRFARQPRARRIRSCPASARRGTTDPDAARGLPPPRPAVRAGRRVARYPLRRANALQPLARQRLVVHDEHTERHDCDTGMLTRTVSPSIAGTEAVPSARRSRASSGQQLEALPLTIQRAATARAYWRARFPAAGPSEVCASPGPLSPISISETAHRDGRAMRDRAGAVTAATPCCMAFSTSGCRIRLGTRASAPPPRYPKSRAIVHPVASARSRHSRE